MEGNDHGNACLADGVAGTLKKSFARAFAYLQSNKSALGVARDFDTSYFHIESIDLLGNKVEGEIGVALLVACCSILSKASSLPGLLMGDMSIQGNLKPARSWQNRFKLRWTMAP